MEPRLLHHLASACGGERVNGPPDVTITRVVTDSRVVESGDLFVPLKGEHFDGHDFLGEVAVRGAAATLVSRAALDALPEGFPAIVVEDPRRAYGEIAAGYRRDFDLPIVCVGGSNGKTTTKELVAAVLDAVGPVLKSESSFNNEVGVP